MNDIGAVCVTYGPGLVGALLSGVSTAKAMAYAAGIPLVGVHHIEGHISANYYTFLRSAFCLIMALHVIETHSLPSTLPETAELPCPTVYIDIFFSLSWYSSLSSLNLISSQIDIHKLYGGVVPEIASRKHIERINLACGFPDLASLSIAGPPG